MNNKSETLQQIDGHINELHEHGKFDKMDNSVNELLTSIIRLANQNRLDDAKTLLSSGLLKFIEVGADGAIDMLSFVGAIEYDKAKGQIVGLKGAMNLEDAYLQHSLHMFKSLTHK